MRYIILCYKVWKRTAALKGDGLTGTVTVKNINKIICLRKAAVTVKLKL